MHRLAIKNSSGTNHSFSSVANDWVINAGSSLTIPVNPAELSNVEGTLSGLTGVTWRRVTEGWERTDTYIDAGSFSGTLNDLDPTGWDMGGASVILIAGTGVLPTVTGLARGRDGRRAELRNIGSVGVVMTNQGTGSSSSNRFIAPGLANLTLGAGASTPLLYVAGSTNRWYVG